MCQLTIVNKTGNVVADGVTPETFMSFKSTRGRGSALIVELHCGEDIFVEIVRALKRLPKKAAYKARLLERVPMPPAGLDSAGHNVWAAA